jgi:hypothetical protein
MSAYNLTDKKFELWNSSEVAEFIQSKADIPDSYGELFKSHKIDGSIAHKITDNDLKDMGITAIGDRHRIITALESLKAAKEQKDREKILWEGNEVLYWSGCNKCCTTCCGICKDDPEHYTLRSNYLEIKRPDYNRCGSMKCCFGHSYQIDTIDLSNVNDVDVDGIPPPCIQQCCCGAKTHEHIHVNLSNNKNTEQQGSQILKLKKPIGEEVSRKIKNQVEIMQMMERN